MAAHPLDGRTGAVRFSAIPAEVLRALHAGEVATVNLVEYMAIDVRLLAPVVATQIGLNPSDERLIDTLAMLDAIKPLQRHNHVARALYDMAQQHPQRDAVATRLAQHPSDVARCWAAFWLQCAPADMATQLQRVRPFAADPHFGVREMAWSAVRNDVIARLDEALGLLQPWTREADENLRRFATEVTRPRGVWCAQIEVLKAEPWRVLALLEPLRADPSRYVQNSVANWLNDASKTQPAWVAELCARWERESPGRATGYITRRALRTLRKAEQA
ncbi:DNA alkylation repair protein [Curvibacter sp. APW13]|uniref:DNA alkylation repair protein n=1 Tax=Curvibacter sp. APW13 TaxID=3077236 RepID=UPI0028E03D38|nr:DNA alkylation repair protein [Curvibacter sp. APW13]MDT8989649.1 DNA alkylation repair protein [Curvibacter sp. APW13]